MTSKAIAAPYSDKDWQAEQDMRTLVEAAEIRKDAPRLKKALACAKQKSEELAALGTKK